MRDQQVGAVYGGEEVVENEEEMILRLAEIIRPLFMAGQTSESFKTAWAKSLEDAKFAVDLLMPDLHQELLSAGWLPPNPGRKGVDGVLRADERGYPVIDIDEFCDIPEGTKARLIIEPLEE
jgi:hypothetical protein